jgi:lipoprotein-anchoring transpeptidase ErfK/SrfK
MLQPNRKNALAFTITLVFTLLNSYSYAAQKNYNFFDTFNPKEKNAEKVLQQMDRDYEQITGLPSHLKDESTSAYCYKSNCKILAKINLNTQRMDLYIDGILTYTWKVSTGRFGFETPPMETNPDGRIYERHTSPKYPQGDYDGLGNMPFAVFIDGDYAIHGTTRGSWDDLGTPASHGCVRLHPDNAEMFNVMVRRAGIKNVWISIEL